MSGFLTDAIAAINEDDPDRPIELRPGTWVRAAWLVEALAPEIVERARAHVAQEMRLRDAGVPS